MVAADFTGDASDDVIVFGYDGHFTLAKGADGNGATTKAPDLMTSATKLPAASVSSFEYKTLIDTTVYIPGTAAAYPLQNVRGPRYVLSRLVYPNGAGGSNDKIFGYKRGLNQFTHRDFLGYEMVWEVDGGTGLRVETIRSQDYPNVGRVTDVRTLINSTLQMVKHHVRTVGSVLNFEGKPASALVSDQISNLGLNGEWQSDYITYSYDGYGNIQSISYAKDEFSYPTSLRKQETTYFQNDPTLWLFGVPTGRYNIQWSDEGTSAAQNYTLTTYPGTRLIQTEVREPSIPAYTVTTTYTRDAFGNALSTSVSAAGVETRTTSALFDARGRFVTSATNAMGHVTLTTFDPKFGGLLSSSDPNSLTTTWQYDGFGRKTLESRPDGTQTTWAYEGWGTCCSGNPLSPSQTHRVREQTTGNSSPTYTSYDELERVVLVQKRNFADNGWVYTKNIWYDAKGKVARSYLPYDDSQTSPPYERMLYDTLGRLETKFAGDGYATSYSYSAAPSAGHVSTTIRNSRTYDTTYVRSVRGQLRQVIDANGKTTSYEYAPTGQLSKVTDALGNQTLYEYDQYGNMFRRTDPDLGVWTYLYDRLGQLIGQTDAKNQTTYFTYDKLGRKTTRGEPNTVASWTWDAATKGVGKLASSTAVWPSGNFVRSYTYDSFGRPSSETMSYPGGGAYTMSTSYDSASRPLTLTYPSGFAVKNVYNAAGYMAEVRNNATNALFWKANVVTAAGITDEDYGNGTGVSRVFDAYTQRLNQIAVLRDSDGALLQGFNYTYDPVGNIASRTETSQNVPETFAYDALDRLTVVNHLNLWAAHKTFAYDDIGNITSKSDVGTYTYPITGKVHAVSNVAGTPYAYDANGNLNNSGSATFSWTVSNLPSLATAGASTYNWAYDADNNRTKFWGPSETRLYFGRGTNLLYEIAIATTTDQRHYIHANGVVVAQYTVRSSGTNDLRYLYRDHLGSTTLIADESGNVTERLSYDANGKRRFPTGADDTGNTLTGNATDLGFTGHEQLEEVGLIHMNGRLYDPRIARFISSDPAPAKTESGQLWNRYSYVVNNPFVYTDPTGFEPFQNRNPVARQNPIGGVIGPEQIIVEGNPLARLGDFGFIFGTGFGGNTSPGRGEQAGSGNSAANGVRSTVNAALKFRCMMQAQRPGWQFLLDNTGGPPSMSAIDSIAQNYVNTMDAVDPIQALVSLGLGGMLARNSGTETLLQWAWRTNQNANLFPGTPALLWDSPRFLFLQRGFYGGGLMAASGAAIEVAGAAYGAASSGVLMASMIRTFVNQMAQVCLNAVGNGSGEGAGSGGG